MCFGTRSNAMSTHQRSDPHKVTRGFREHMLDFHKTLHTRKNEHGKCQNDVLPCFTYIWFGALQYFVEVYKVLRLPRKLSPRHSKCCASHTESSSCPKSNMTTGSQNETFDLFETSSKFIKYCACTKNDLQNHLSFWPTSDVTPANVLATSRKYQKVPRRPCGWASVRRKTTCQTSKCPEMPRLSHEMAIAQKTSTKPRW